MKDDKKDDKIDDKKDEQQDDNKDDKKEDDKSDTKSVDKEKDDKLNPEQEKMVGKLVERMNKFSTSMEKADEKIIDNSRVSAEERKKLLSEITTMKAELDPYIEKDKEVMTQKVKEEVENALLIIMDK